MSLADVNAEILEPMQRLFLPPRNMDAEAQRGALNGYGEVLKGYAREDLRTAWVEVVTAHVARSWPVPGVIVLACRKAAKERHAESGEQPSRFSRQVVNYSENRLRWEKIRGSQMARDAAKGGFAWSLKCMVLNDGKKAEEIDIRTLSADHFSAERTANSLQNGERVWDRYREKWVEFSDDNAALALKMWRNILVNEAATAEEIRRHAGAQ